MRYLNLQIIFHYMQYKIAASQQLIWDGGRESTQVAKLWINQHSQLRFCILHLDPKHYEFLRNFCFPCCTLENETLAAHLMESNFVAPQTKQCIKRML